MLKQIYYLVIYIPLKIINLRFISKNTFYDAVILKIDGGYGDYYIFSKYLERYCFHSEKKILLITSFNMNAFLNILPFNNNLKIINISYFGLKNILYIPLLILKLSKIKINYLINASFKNDLLRSELIFACLKSTKKFKFTFDNINYKENESTYFKYNNSVIALMDALFLKFNELGLVQNVSIYCHNNIELNEDNPKNDYVIINELSRDPKRSLIHHQWDKIIEYLLSKNQNIKIFSNRNFDNSKIKKLPLDNIDKSIKIIQKAKLVITPETFVSHVAAFERVNSICILGGGHYGKFMPYMESDIVKIKEPEYLTNYLDCFGCNWNCKYKDKTYRCVDIDVENIFINIDKLLNDQCGNA